MESLYAIQQHIEINIDDKEKAFLVLEPTCDKAAVFTRRKNFVVYVS